MRHEKQTGKKALQKRRKRIKLQISKTFRRDEKDFLKRLMMLNYVVKSEYGS